MTRLSSPFRIGLAPGPKLRPAIFVGAQRIARHQRPRDRPDQRQLLGVHDAEHRQSVMAELAHLLIVVAAEHRGQMGDAEAHLGAERGAEQFLRHRRHVDRRRRLEAIVAIAAAARAGPRRNGAAGSRGGRSRPRRRRRARSAARAPAAAAPARPRSRSGWRARAKSSAPQNSQASAGSPSRPARPVSW